ncbi:MAG TPA: hypothetical protein VEA18_03635, partial [Candidatus Kapabacteria bacterium]|nr:hypothetical protein [Candidatus Kapabacteria bacterium]
MDIGLFHIEFEPLLQFLGQHPVAVLTQLFAIGGWVIFAYMLLYVGIDYYQGYRQDMHTAHWKWVVLAIDIPIMNAQTPKAVEQMFTQLAGALEHGDIADHYRGGHKQRWFSFEIISIEGYIQFLIRTEEGYRDLVEASIYAQYPEAEITEVEDYVESVPGTFPNPEYEMWASDFTLAENDAYPIRTYREFEHTISKDMVLKDPMSAFLEAFSRIGPGEQLWFQILIEPTGNSWKEKAISKIKEVIGDTSGHGGKNWVDKMSDLPIKALVTVGDQIFGREASPPGEDSHEGPSNNLSSLTPGQTKLVEAMENKISYIGFKTKIRAVYVARKEVFRKDRAVAGLVGAI